jgi:hypothetical protein
MYRAWRRPRYPVVSVDWGESPDAKAKERLRDCGHWASSFAYDPVQERGMCLECYRALRGKARATKG